MTLSNTFRAVLMGTAALSLIVAAGTATARPKALPDAVEIDRPVDDLPGDIRPYPHDTDRVETVLIFTNPTARPVVVHCMGYARDGSSLGRVRVRVGANGLRHILGADISNGADFLGHVQCRASGRVVPSAVLVGPTIENLNVVGGGGARQILFPVVASL